MLQKYDRRVSPLRPSHCIGCGRILRPWWGAARVGPGVTSPASLGIFRSARAMLHTPDDRSREQAIRARRARVQGTSPRLATQVPKVSRRCSISAKPAVIIAARSFSALRKVSTERGR